ncbi:unnamed protein product, partial [Medioppia subpectinata]
MCEKVHNGKALLGMMVHEFGTNTLNMRRKCKSERRLDGKVVVITGANTGIGKETALQLSLRGAKIYIGCRSLEKAESAIDDMKGVNPSADITALKLDLSSFKSVRQFADELKARESAVDILINNAGVMACPEWQTTDGFEMQFGTNYLGPFLLTKLLLPQLKRAQLARIVNVSSSMHAIGRINFDNINLRNGVYDPTLAYGQSKLAVVLSTRELARRLGPESSVTCYVLNPGAIKTDLQRHSNMGETMMNMMFMTPELGAQTTLYCALEETLDNESGFYYDDKKLNGQVVVVTGGNTGIGKETAHQLALRDAKVYILCRDTKKGETAVNDILSLNPKANIKLLSLDLSSLKSVRKCVEELSGLETKVDILINNAGVAMCPEWQTEDGFEMQIGTNHLGHFLFTLHLIPLLKKAPAGRIVNVSAEMYKFGRIHLDNINLRNGAYDNLYAYAQSKLANILFTRELAKRLRHSNITAYCLHPGVINTNLSRHVDNPELHETKGQTNRGWFYNKFFMTPLMGSQTTLYCALEDKLANESGFYYNNCVRVDHMTPEANDDSTAKSLWELSCDLCKSERRLDGKVVVITGANTGIGKETALQLSLRGAKIYIGCRSLEKAESAIDDMKGVNPSADITALKLDLSSFKSIHQFADELKARESVVDILINNAGVMACPEWQTTDGFEMQFGTNYLGPFLLTQLLLPQMKRAQLARIVNVSSSMHAIGRINFDNINLRNGVYDPTLAYGQSKLAVVLSTRELARRLGPESSVTCYALNPGAIKTDLQRHSNMGETMMNMMFMAPEMGAQTTLYCALEETLDNESGFYYDNCKRVEKMAKRTQDDETARKLWDLSIGLVYILCRDTKKGETAVNDILALTPKANIKLLSLVTQLSGLETKVDILINNAGVAMCPEWKTEDGFEMQMGTNHLGHFLFTLHLIPLLKKAPAGRIVNVSADMYKFGQIHLDNINLRDGAYDNLFAYAQSKLANILFTRELAKRLRHSNITAY